MVALSPLAGAGWQFFGNNGLPLAGGKLYTYAAGTTTPLATYTSNSGVTPHANPIILDSAGRVPSEVWLTTSLSYKFTLKTAANVEIWTKDNVPGIDAELRSDLASTAVGKGAALVSFTSGQTLRVLDTVQPLRLSIELGAGGGDETSAFYTKFLSKMNSQQRPAIIDRDISISGFTTINGYCVVTSEGDATITFTGGSSGFNAINTSTLLGSWTAAPTLTRWPASNGSYNTALTVDAATYAGLATGDNVYLSDSVNNTFVYKTTNYTNLAEIAMVVAKDGGNTIYLDRVLGEWNLYSASGTVTKLGDNPCVLNLNVNGERTVVRELIRIEGYARPRIDAVINGNSSRGVMLVGCLAPRVRAFVDNLRDDEPTAYGYGVCAAAATTDAQIEVNAKRVRHAYSDIIIGTTTGASQPEVFKGGVVRRSSVTGVADSCTAASWDTHPFSDSVRFENIKAWATHNVALEQPDDGLNYAMQVRGTNVTVDGFETNMQRGIIYAVDAPRDSALNVSNFTHHNTLVGSPTSANSLLSFKGFSFAGTGSHLVNIRNSDIQNLSYGASTSLWNFVQVHNTDIDMGTSSSGWAGSDAANLTSCETIFNNCRIKNPVNMQVKFKLTLDGGKVLKSSTAGFDLLNGAVLTSHNHGIEITGGGNIANSAYAYSSISGATDTASFIYANVWVDDGRASGTVRPFTYTSSGATVTSKDVATRAPIYATATVDLPSIAAQSSTTFDVTVPGVSTSIVWAVAVNPSADLGALAMTAWVQATNTVRVRVVNPTAAPIDAPSVTMTVVAQRAV